MLALISRTRSLEKTLASIDSFLKTHEFAHIISLNPENMVEASDNPAFRRAYDLADLVIADGVGITIASRILRIPCGERITGVDLMRKLIHTYPNKRIVFVGGLRDVAQKTLEYFKDDIGTQGEHWKAFQAVDPSDPHLLTDIILEKPDLLFVALGSPKQELWIEKHRDKLTSTVCVGVGQAFDVYAGKVKRAPRLIQALGLEWLYRLVIQPWRWRRQLRLLKFVFLIMRYRLFMR